MMFKISIASGLLAASLSLTSVSGWADQNHPDLPDLFQDLQAASTAEGAARTASEIWRLWIYHDTNDDVNRLMQQGISAMESGDLRLADRLFTDIIALEPAFAEGWNKRATVRFQMGRFQASRQDIAEVLKREERHFGALAGLGLVELHLQNPEAALQAYQAALSIYPKMTAIQSIIQSLEEQLRGQML